jgi:glutathione S-transferase
MAIKMYDLAGSDNNRRFSPFCWRTKMALAHKGLEVETIPWHFTEKNVIAFAGSERVPVIVDGSRAVKDSWAIANYLEDTYPDRPSLFGGAAGRALSRFYNTWADGVLHPGIARLIVKDICEHIGPADREYFRKDREARLGMKLEEFCAGREERVNAFRQSLEPLRQVVAAQPFLGGGAPLYPDYIAFGAFQWSRAISSFVLLEAPDPINQWRQRMLDLYGGLARKAPGYW